PPPPPPPPPPPKKDPPSNPPRADDRSSINTERSPASLPQLFLLRTKRNRLPPKQLVSPIQRPTQPRRKIQQRHQVDNEQRQEKCRGNHKHSRRIRRAVLRRGKDNRKRLILSTRNAEKLHQPAQK